MLLAYAGTYAYFAERLAAISAALRNGEEGTVRAAQGELRTLLPAIASNCGALGCTSAVAQAERICGWLKEGTLEGIPRGIEDLSLRLTDDLKNRWFLYIDPEFVTLYDDLEPFGTLVASRFPSAATDIGEAAKCLAVGRATACVYHLMRVCEVGLKAILRVLGLTNVATNWGAYIKAINGAIKGHPDEPFFQEIAGDLQSIKLAWRNPSMHVERTYTIPEAHDIFRAVRTLMQTLATKVGEA
jgi:hypothetical protein